MADCAAGLVLVLCRVGRVWIDLVTDLDWRTRQTRIKRQRDRQVGRR